MKLVDIDETTEETFFHCLHDVNPVNPEVTQLRRRWHERNMDNGLRAKVLRRAEDDAIVGLCQYIPIEHSPLQGKDLMVILCIWVHGFEQHIGDQQKKGYGRFMLDSIEADAKASGAKGVVAWGMNFPDWYPVSFFEHLGYERVETRHPVVLCWKPFSQDAKPPAMKQPDLASIQGTDKVKVTVFLNGWCCAGCSQALAARKAVDGLSEHVDYEEVDTTNQSVMMSWGIDSPVFLDDKQFCPYGAPWTGDELRAEILKLSERKRQKRETT